MDIAHFPADESDLEIPLVVDATRSGEFTLTATDLDLPVGMTLYLHDRHTGQSMPINSTGFKYTFHLTDDASPKQISTSTHTADGSRHQIPPSTHMAYGSANLISTPTQIADGSRKQISTSTYMADGSRNGLIAASPMAITDPANTAITEADRFMITTSPGAPQNEIPGQVALDQNYPNPFNPATQITYHLPGQSQVHLDVFDITGRKIATLVDEQMGAGSHTASFSAEFLSTGVYIYRLTAHGMDGTSQTLTRKLTLIK